MKAFAAGVGITVAALHISAFAVLAAAFANCTAADQQKAQAALDKANQTIDQVCAERAATKDGGAPVMVSVDAGK